MTEVAFPHAYALKQIAETVLKRGNDENFAHGRPRAHLVDGSALEFDAVRVERGIFQFLLSSPKTGRGQLSCVPPDMIVRISASVPVAMSPDLSELADV
jgi:hypothetical protein